MEKEDIERRDGVKEDKLIFQFSIFECSTTVRGLSVISELTHEKLSHSA